MSETRHLSSIALALLLAPTLALAAPERDIPVSVHADAPGLSVAGTRVHAAGAAVVNFSDLARREALRGGPRPPVRALLQPELEEPAEPVSAVVPQSLLSPPFEPFAASPTPTTTFMGLDDIPMADSSYIVIPPDCGGAVGQTRILQGLNNNYRILNKADGSVISTVGTATFWAPTGETALNGLTDPRTLYDPINNRWIVETQTVTTGAGDILLGVSQTSDPAGSWFLFRFAVGATIDFPIMGFNRDWVAVTINRYSNGGTFSRGITLVVNYPQLRAGTFSGTLFAQAAGTHFCSAPCATYSSTSDTLYVVTHLSSAGGTYAVDAITGTSTPAYTTGSTQTRPGGGWVQPNGGILPQSVPNAGASACSPPCPIETQDSQVRSAPVYRGGAIFYTQTVGLPSSGLTHTAAQWTKLATPGGAVVDGGRIEDATATATNGGKWYAYPHIATNAAGDFIVGYSQFSSAQHPSAGYSMHLAGDGAGTIRDPVIYKPGEDYYHKEFGGGRNRWGDFSQAQVDPTDDHTLWVVEEYGKSRILIDDNSLSGNSSRWSTYWASVAGPVPVASLAAGPSQNEGNSGTTVFNFTVNLSSASSLPVTVDYQTTDGSATVADNDYQSASGSIVIPAGSTSGTIPVDVVGDTNCEATETFSLGLTGATNATVGSPAAAIGTIVNDDAKTIAASAGAGGTITPSGAVPVACNASQAFTITPAAGNHIADVLVDGVSQGALTTYTFSNVTADHTIAASFAADTHTLQVVVVGRGAVAKSPDQPTYDHGTSVELTATPDSGFGFTGWSGDASGATNPLTLLMDANKVVTATFADTAAPLVHVVAPNGSETWAAGGSFDFEWTAVDNDSVAAVDLFLSRDGASGPFETIALGAPNSGLFAWAATGPATEAALVRIVAHDRAGNVAADSSDALFTITEATGVEGGPVTALTFARVQPNPVASAAHLTFGLPRDARVELGILDVRGREVAVLVSDAMPAGWHSLVWDGRTTSGRKAGPGVYLARLTCEGRRMVRRFALVH